MSMSLVTLKHETSESLVTEPSARESEIAIKNFKRYKSPDIVQMPAELIQSASRRLRPEILKLVNYFYNRKEFPHLWKKSITVPISKKVRSNYQVLALLSAESRFCLILFSPLEFNVICQV